MRSYKVNAVELNPVSVWMIQSRRRRDDSDLHLRSVESTYWIPDSAGILWNRRGRSAVVLLHAYFQGVTKNGGSRSALPPQDPATLLHTDSLWLLLLRFSLGDVHAQDSILTFAADDIRVDILRQGETALEAGENTYGEGGANPICSPTCTGEGL